MRDPQTVLDLGLTDEVFEELKKEHKTKTSLTPAEKIRAAAAKLMYGTSDAEIALILGVSNLGRVNEALKEVLAAQGLTRPGYKRRQKK